MKIISLNAYFGSAFDGFMTFLDREAPTTDIFLFQEMLSNPKNDLGILPSNDHFKHGAHTNIVQEIADRLPDFEMIFAPMQDDFDITPGYPNQMTLGIALFYRKTLTMTGHGHFFIYNQRNSFDGKNYETLGHNAIYAQIDVAGTPLTVIGLHGNSEPGNKLDTPKRLKQSQAVIDFAAARPGEKIVMGDFNIFPETKSVGMFEEAGFHNLVKEHNVTTTRGSLHKKLNAHYANTPLGFQEFADFTFTTPGVHVKSFEIPDVPVSDHLPMILECEV